MINFEKQKITLKSIPIGLKKDRYHRENNQATSYYNDFFDF